MNQETGSELIVIQQADALAVYSTPNAIDPYLSRIAAEVADFSGDASTAKGRAEIRSLAYRVTRSKTYLDDLGKQLAAELKEIPKRIDASRKQARDFLEELAEKVRAPLTEWEAEQERIEAEKKAAEEAVKLAEQIERDYETALLENELFDRRRAEELARQAELAKERERIAREEGELKAREEAERKIVEARMAEELAARAKEDAERRAREAEQMAERERQASEERARIAAEQSAARERQRIADEQRQVAEEQARREANINHRKSINRQALTDLMQHAELTEDQGKAVILAIIAGKISSTHISY
jgi:colicin import membrane protein